MIKPKITLHLGAGSARGLAHVGVLRAFEENKIPYDMLVGVSMGAVVGGFYATEPDWRKTEESMESILLSDTFKESFMEIWPQNKAESARSFLHSVHKIYLRTGVVGRILLSDGIIPEENIDEVFLPRYPKIFIQQTKIPFGCVAVDLLKGSTFFFTGGKLIEAVLASSSIPMVFPPRKINGNKYIDGGVLDKLGIDASDHLKADYRIAVDVSNPDFVKPEEVDSALDVLTRSLEIAEEHRLVKQYKKVDLVLKPIRRNVHIGEFGAYKEMIEMGYEYTLEKMEEIRDVLNVTHPWKKYFYFPKRKRISNKLFIK